MIINDDCMNVLQSMESESVDMVVTDCPYHIVSGGCSNDAVKIGRYIMFNDANPLTYTKQGKLFKHNEIKFEQWLPEVYRVLKNGTHCYIMINHRNLNELWIKAEDVGFVFQNLIVWDKGNSTPNKYYMNAYELIFNVTKRPCEKDKQYGDN